MKNILLLTDFSESSINAINYTLELFNEDICAFYVMHVHKMGTIITDDLLSYSGNTNVHDSIIEEPKQKINSLIAILKKAFNNTKYAFEAIIDYDDFSDAVNQIVKSKKIDLIALGTNGKTGIKELVFGSNTLDVIKNVDCTTLVIPIGYSYKAPKKVLLSLNNENSLSQKAILELHNFIENHNLKLNVLKMLPNNSEPSNDCNNDEQILKGEAPYEHFVVNDVPVEHATKSIVQINKIDIAAICVHKESLFEHFLSKSSSTKIAYSLKVPLLILHK